MSQEAINVIASDNQEPQSRDYILSVAFTNMV